MTTTRQQILDTAAELIEAQGYHATGLSEIIRVSGAPKGSLYYYFPGGKEELVAEAVRSTGGTVLERIRTELDRFDDAVDAVREFLLTLAQHVAASEYRGGGPITTVALESATTAEQINLACREVYASWQAAFADKLVASGVASPRATRLASVLVATLEGAIVLCRTRHSPAPLVSAADEMGLLLGAAMPDGTGVGKGE